MGPSARLQLKQTQSLVITPQLMQAIRLLQMSAFDLDRFVAGEIEQNPLLDRDGGPEAIGDGPDTLDTAERLAEAAEVEADAPELSPEQAGAEDSFLPFIGSRTAGPSPDWDGAEQDLPATESLTEVLERAIHAAFEHAPADRFIAQALLGELDDAGYLSLAPEALALRLGAAPAAVERVLGRCQELAPTGMFARSLAECLALQLAERNRLDPAMQTLLKNLPQLAGGDRGSLAALCGVDRSDLDAMVAEIRVLDPKPGLAYSHDPAPLPAPDVFVRPGPDGGWRVELNDETLPRVIVNHAYCAEVSSRAECQSGRKFVADCLQKASWLEKSLQQRAQTVLRVAAEIVRHQERFLAEGVAYLRPLNLRMVADALGIHESTVSRAAANKTMATPRGIFEFRYFFNGGLAATTGGEAHSVAAVKDKIRRMIAQESPDAVLSDDAIVRELGREGVEIARRTVAKYREAMRIGSSVERRRAKKLKAAS